MQEPMKSLWWYACSRQVMPSRRSTLTIPTGPGSERTLMAMQRFLKLEYSQPNRRIKLVHPGGTAPKVIAHSSALSIASCETLHPKSILSSRVGLAGISQFMFTQQPFLSIQRFGWAVTLLLQSRFESTGKRVASFPRYHNKWGYFLRRKHLTDSHHRVTFLETSARLEPKRFTLVGAI